jgi:hypothetical protein
MNDHHRATAKLGVVGVVLAAGVTALMSVVGAAASATTSQPTPDPIPGDWSVTYGSPSVVTMSGSSGSYAVTAKSRIQVVGAACFLPPGTMIATFSKSGGSYSGQHGLWYPSNCSFARWDPMTLVLNGKTLTANLAGLGPIVFTKIRDAVVPKPSQPSAPPSFLSSIHSGSSQPPISSTLASPLQAFASPLHTLVNLALAAAVVLFITFPSQLFNRTLEENWVEIRRRLVRFLHLPKRLEAPAPTAPGRPEASTALPVFVLVVLLGTIMGGLLNPSFGFNLPTLIALIGSALTIACGLTISYWVARTFRTARHVSSTTYFKALPAGLLIGAVCVLISRLSGFTPGYFYGLVYSLAFVVSLPKAQNGQLVTLSSLAALLVSVLAWFAWTPLHSLNITGLGALGLLVLTTTLASLFVGGLVGSLLSLIPLRFLVGHQVFAWRRSVWAFTFGLAVFLVLQVLLLPAQGGHAGNAPLVTTIIFLVVFGAVSIAFWWYFARRKDVSPTPESPPPSPTPAGAPCTNEADESRGKSSATR